MYQYWPFPPAYAETRVMAQCNRSPHHWAANIDKRFLDKSGLTPGGDLRHKNPNFPLSYIYPRITTINTCRPHINQPTQSLL